MSDLDQKCTDALWETAILTILLLYTKIHWLFYFLHVVDTHKNVALFSCRLWSIKHVIDIIVEVSLGQIETLGHNVGAIHGRNCDKTGIGRDKKGDKKGKLKDSRD